MTVVTLNLIQGLSHFQAYFDQGDPGSKGPELDQVGQPLKKFGLRKALLQLFQKGLIFGQGRKFRE